MSTAPLLLVLAAACIHATWNLLAKQVRGGMEVVWLYSCVGAAVFAPWGLTEYYREWHRLGWREVFSLAGSCGWQLAYFVCLQQAYKHGDLSLVYPIARGTGPVVAAMGAMLILGEAPALVAWTGIAMISGGVLFFLRGGSGLGPAAAWGLATGMLIGAYSLWDKFAVSGLNLPPIMVEWTTDVSRAAVLAPVALRRAADTRRLWANQRGRLVKIGILNPSSYILVLTAMTMAPLHRVAALREIGIVISALFGARFMGERQPGRRLIGAVIMVLGVLFLAGCSVERPVLQPRQDRLLVLRMPVAPPVPQIHTDNTADEAEIQYRAALVFYRRARWDYAVPAFAEVLTYDDDRDDARFYLAASLAMLQRDQEALPLLTGLLETPYEMQARPVLARLLFRTGRREEARAAIAPAARENVESAVWASLYDLLSQ